MDLNASLFSFFHQFTGQSTFVDGTIRFLADPLGILIIVGLAWYLLDHHVHKHVPWELAAFLGIGFLAVGIATFIKHVFPTPRPFDYFPSLVPLITISGAAFPSAHTAFYSALGGAMVVKHRRAGMFIIVLSLVIGLARVAAGVHWPYDIAGGFILGTTLGITLTRLYYRKLCEILKICIL